VFENPQSILQQIYLWTQGQPFLTQRLCQLAVQASVNRMQEALLATSAYRRAQPDLDLTLRRFRIISPSTFIDQLVHTHIIDQWELQDNQLHFHSIRDRLIDQGRLTEKMLEVYQKLLRWSQVRVNTSPEQLELRFSGLVIKDQGYLRIRNRIYRKVFNQEWVNQQLEYAMCQP
jgi:hypothetical protein